MKLFDMVTYRQRFIPPHIVNHLLSLTDSPPHPTTVGHGDGQSISDYRSTGRHRMPPDIISNVMSTVHQIHDDILKPRHKTTAVSIEEPQLLSYGPGGKYDRHNDSEDYVDNVLTRVVPRDWTVLWYLNDGYTGGQIELCNLNITFSPKAGDMLIFPSYHEFEHAVHPVTSGTRKCLVTWIETDRRIYER